MKLNLTKLYILKRRDEFIWQAHIEGYTSGDISEMFNKLNRTWITRIIKKMPLDWKPESNHKKAF